MSGMKAASLDSPRLQRMLAVLEEGVELTTRELSHRAEVMAVSAAASELRSHGAILRCRPARGPKGGRVWLYRLDGWAGGRRGEAARGGGEGEDDDGFRLVAPG